MKIIVLVCVLFAAGCDTGEPDAPDAKRIASGKLRQALFSECMSLASANTRQGDDDVSDLIDSCDTYAFYTSKQQLDY